MEKRLITCLSLMLALGANGAHAYVIDGNLADWGVKRTGHASDWTPNPVQAYLVEDQTGGPNTYMNPGYGGQKYDAEAMYLDWDNQNLYIAIATGHSPLTPNTGSQYAAGDIAIDFGKDGTWDYGIELLGSAHTTAGHIYSNVTWAYGLWSAPNVYNPSHADRTLPTSILSGTDLGSLATIALTTVGQNNYGQWASDLHYFYELAIPLSVFAGHYGEYFDVQWTMNCANDAIRVDPPLTARVPEPGTLALLPLGVMGLMAMRRRKHP